MLSDTLCNINYFIRFFFRYNDYKLFTAKSTDKVVFPAYFLQKSRKLLQHLISSIMPESVIYLFKVIYINCNNVYLLS